MLTLQQVADSSSGLSAKKFEDESLESLIVTSLEAVAPWLQLGKDLAFAVTGAEDQGSYELHPEEARLVSERSCRKRQLQWNLGRAAAHRAFKQLGFAYPPPVLRGDRGEPLWPKGISGSITHCDPWSVAVLAKGPNLSIGIDLESLKRFQGTDVSHLICRRSELERLREVADLQGHLAMIFSAKEALYKSLYPFLRRYVDFTEVELSWSQEQSCFHAEVLLPEASCLDGGPVAVSCRRHQHWIFSGSIARSMSLAT